MSVPSNSFLIMLHRLRQAELVQAARYLSPGSRVLEIGGGTGFQAKLLTEMGHDVECLDVAASDYRESRVFPVREFDGIHLPFDAGGFDVVFSSNVLEHVGDLSSLNTEIRRVIKPGGQCLHVLPSPTWRLWTSMTHFPALPLLALERAYRRGGDTGGAPNSSGSSLTRLLTRALWPGRHGEHGTALSEVYLFSRFRWRKLFRTQGFDVVDILPMGILYTGYALLGARLSLSNRRQLARVFGSSSVLYRLRPSTTNSVR